MAIDFPASPTNGQAFTSGNVTWIWDGTKWGVPTSAGSSLYLPLTGGTMTGDIVLKGDPDQPLEPVTKQMLDARPTIGDNRIINGDMRIDQRNNGATITPINLAYTLDRWQYTTSVASKFSVQRGSNPALTGAGFGYSLLAVSLSAYTAATSETFHLQQPIEADFVSDFLWGLAGAQPVTLSFRALSTLTGAFSGAICASGGVRSYPFTFSLPAANTWTNCAITIPGDTVGLWTLTGNGVGVIVRFNLGAGANFLGPAGAWANANYVGATGSVNVVGTNAATFQVTGVKLEIGSVATPYNRKTMQDSLADCQRYYTNMSNCIVASYNTAGAAVYANVYYPTSMRAQPTVAITGVTATNASGLTTSAIAGSATTFMMTITATAQGTATFAAAFTAEL